MHLELKFDRVDDNSATPQLLAVAASPSELGLISGRPDMRAGQNGCQPQTQGPPWDPGDSGFDYRRVLDILVSLSLIVLLAPMMVLTAAAIFFSDGGPPMFLHRRVGRDGKIFSCFKFRSMCVNAEGMLERYLMADPNLQSRWQDDHKLEDDPRVTRLGKLLRVTSIDEIPQLFNVLWGNMTLVGPRPIVAAELPRYGRYASYYLSVKPGLTGLWQVTGRSLTTYRRRVATDVLYVRSRSFQLDFRILLNTIPAVLRGDGSC